MERSRDDEGEQTAPEPSRPVARAANGPPHVAAQASSSQSRHSQDRNGWRGNVYGALDLGTNNCRLLLARPSRRGFRVVDAFSRIIRLGEGVSTTGRLSQAAMDRTVDALRVCRAKLLRHNVERHRLVATQACRVAQNGPEFLLRVKLELGLEIEVLTAELEAGLAVSGCSSLMDPDCDYVMVFDIGGGSSEIVWLDRTRRHANDAGRFGTFHDGVTQMVAWESLPVGVVTLAERFGGRDVSPESFAAMVAHVVELIDPFEARHNFRNRVASAPMHMLGTSGTVTTIAGIQLGLLRYDRNKVDGCWITVEDARSVTSSLLNRTYEERVAEPCIGHERADLVLAGCAILEAFLTIWPCERLRVADRGLREGILAMLMTEDGVYQPARRPRGPANEPWRR